jgi:hypothetical protein
MNSFRDTLYNAENQQTCNSFCVNLSNHGLRHWETDYIEALLDILQSLHEDTDPIHYVAHQAFPFSPFPVHQPQPLHSAAHSFSSCESVVP